MNNHLFDAIRTAANTGGVFIETIDGRIWTYDDMLAQSGRLASVLGQLGVHPGDRVAVQVGKSPQALLLYIACLRAGAGYLPPNPPYTLAETPNSHGDPEP